MGGSKSLFIADINLKTEAAPTQGNHLQYDPIRMSGLKTKSWLKLVDVGQIGAKNKSRLVVLIGHLVLLRTSHTESRWVANHGRTGSRDKLWLVR